MVCTSCIQRRYVFPSRATRGGAQRYKDGLYKVPLWVKKSISSESVNEGMGVGSVDKVSEKCGSYERSILDETF